MENVTPNVDAELDAAVQEFICIKRSMNDRRPKSHGFLAWMHSLPREIFIDRRGDGDYACWPSCTLTAVLPFFIDEPALDALPRPARVAVKTTLGSSFKRAEDMRPQSSLSVEENIKFFTDDERATTSTEKAQVRMIRQLGLCYVAGEGKNRVAFLAHHGEEWMPCELQDVDYPSAERLQLIEIREGPQRSWVCVKDGKEVELIAYPELTLVLLNAYGVRVSKWSAVWPMQTTVMNSFRMQTIDYQRLDGLRSVPSYPVDLQELVRRENELRKSQPETSFMAFLHPRLEMRRGPFLGAAAGLLGLSILASYFPLSNPIALAVVCGSACAFLGVAIGLCVAVRIKPEPLASSALAALAADPCLKMDTGTPCRPVGIRRGYTTRRLG
ncbi:hypothetical protein FHT32_003298 [Variovorax sp. SG517]|uniref:hypothetical protein n=1 Tax=Variovorax sp. SG517 TaxID=2587117 RepID=UPI00159DE7D0|nr:hypothetical protein [Variovorax sp. SG517]NVM89641.1 hypothetical protein [Variovorax sp. SG517]